MEICTPTMGLGYLVYERNFALYNHQPLEKSLEIPNHLKPSQTRMSRVTYCKHILCFVHVTDMWHAE